MNTERLLKIADEIEAHPKRFSMDLFVDGDEFWNLADERALEDETSMVTWTTFDLRRSCGTTACIAGWACNLWAAEVDPGDSFSENAERILDLSEWEADDLFFNRIGELPDAATAASFLRDLAAGRQTLAEAEQ